MYKGISMGLLALWAVAFVGSFFGLIAYSPVALVANLLVGVLSIWGASYVCGRIFNVSVHFESSLVTGLILALIVTPSAGAGLIALLFAGIVAGVSKFVVVHNGRHIFNPAALGAFVIGISGVGVVSWWVATPVLAPILFLVVLISLYKTRRMLIAGVFLAVSVPLLLVVFSSYGTALTDNLVLLLSFPILFIAGIMLTEPLTLPPRKWQMYVESAIVGLLVVAPFYVTTFEITPALALLIGNVVALVFLLRSRIMLELKSRVALTPTTDELIFTPNKPIKFTAGQYLEVQIPHKKQDFRGARRSFSMTTVPNTDEVGFGIRFYQPSSSYKKKLKAMPIGSIVSATGYWGDFVLPKDTTKPLLFVAGGIGITPFISHLKTIQNDEKRNIVLLYAVNNHDEIAYKDVLAKAGIKVIIVTKEKLKELPFNWKQIRTSRLSEKDIAQYVTDVSLRYTYVSGPNLFVSASKTALRRLKAKRIKTDYFAGY